jgi:hypothetical protein
MYTAFAAVFSKFFGGFFKLKKKNNWRLKFMVESKVNHQTSGSPVNHSF